MKAVGIVRKVDHLGRIVLPKELRNIMQIHPQDGVEIYVNGDQIILKKYNPTCVLCGKMDKLFYFREKIVCNGCIQEMAKYAKSLAGQEDTE
ncbi:AbrB/MazE/SpoVT family DNA-binding domain-containing protein [Thermoflavimicrobium dichotomicum]|uniref:Transcriptional pleiotropic regulator of transition state genes n=1 Tax=Thermoflavimicrobium dichotomicum TaxID=46223 RepID=A0A1I3V3Z5_9BACL|nr:AbrB/MazE/SpoVT family DNA-binding domain-containing protein [Thermoflavimicrobium dichotomicum]SFJ89663.1 transcriptional pleiotropic regulator of transition state genes [Thermoflavimicrobium dichotomicum]